MAVGGGILSHYVYFVSRFILLRYFTVTPTLLAHNRAKIISLPSYRTKPATRLVSAVALQSYHVFLCALQCMFACTAEHNDATIHRLKSAHAMCKRIGWAETCQEAPADGLRVKALPNALCPARSARKKSVLFKDKILIKRADKNTLEFIRVESPTFIYPRALFITVTFSPVPYIDCLQLASITASAYK